MIEVFKKAPKRHQPKGFEILHEDHDIIVGNKEAGYLSVSALWNQDDTIHSALNTYVRKGNQASRKCVYVVHRIDQLTTGILIYAKSEDAQQFIKDNWTDNEKVYLAIVEGKLKQKSGILTSYLIEDESYRVRSTKSNIEGKLAKTQYEVIKESARFSLVKVNLLTGRKNQIRVHFADLGHPIAGDAVYGNGKKGSKQLSLHAFSLTLTHPHQKTRMTFKAPVPKYFSSLVPFDYAGL